MRTGKPFASKERMKSTPLSPATAARHVLGASLPIGVTAPRPVTTTRRTERTLASLRQPVRNLEVGEEGRHPGSLRYAAFPPVMRRFTSECDRRRSGRLLEATSRLLPLLDLGPLPTRRGLPRAGSATAAKPRDVQGLPRRRAGASGVVAALRRGGRPDDPRARRQEGGRTARSAARLPRHRGLPRALAPVVG